MLSKLFKIYESEGRHQEGIETLKGGKEFLTVLDLQLGGMSDEEKLKTILSQEPVQPPTGWVVAEDRVISAAGADGSTVVSPTVHWRVWTKRGPL